MNNQPLMLSILLGIILILIIGGVSLSVQKSKTADRMQQYMKENIDLQKRNAKLENENKDLNVQIDEFKTKVKTLQEDNSFLSEELEKTRKLKETIEERLKEELIKPEPSAE